MGTLDWAGIYLHLKQDLEDAAAWHSLQRHVRAWARQRLGTRGPDVVEDVVAETCAEVFVSLEKARGAETFGGFCFGHFRNVQRKVRSDGKWTQPLDDFDAPAPEDDGPDPVETALLRTCLEWLREAHPNERRAVELRFFEEQPAAVIAGAIGSDANYARQVVFRGVAHLKKCIGSKLGGR